MVDLDYSDGLSVVSVLVQRGYMPTPLRGWSQVALAGHKVYASDPDELCFAWAARGFVYTLIAAAPQQTVGQVVVVLPHDDGPGWLARLNTACSGCCRGSGRDPSTSTRVAGVSHTRRSRATVGEPCPMAG